MTEITVNGNFVDATGANEIGQVEFTPTSEMYDSVNNIIVPAAAVVIQLENGFFSTSLYATEDPTTQPLGVKYKTVLKLVDGTPITSRPFYFELPYSTAPSVNLSDLTIAS